jgi:hypothetical protein
MLYTAKSTDYYRLQITDYRSVCQDFNLYRLRLRVASVSSTLVTVTYFTNIVRVTSSRARAV